MWNASIPRNNGKVILAQPCQHRCVGINQTGKLTGGVVHIASLAESVGHPKGSSVCAIQLDPLPPSQPRRQSQVSQPAGHALIHSWELVHIVSSHH